jgi:hypothetical protein
MAAVCDQSGIDPGQAAGLHIKGLFWGDINKCHCVMSCFFPQGCPEHRCPPPHPATYPKLGSQRPVWRSVLLRPWPGGIMMR